MTPERWSRIKALFAAAVELPTAARSEFLGREAADDPALIAEVQSLLDAHDQPGAFLEDVSTELRAEAFSSPSTARGRIGERIGAYRIVGVLGTGGMGDVYKAVRDDDQYRAEVAIKLVRADVSGGVIEQRFKNERQILAALDHRNIARLLDGGTTDANVPYVVMELVNGEPIDSYCETKTLPTRDRVRLFLQVCAAVSYAHQHLVVHRDLKPNNIFVTGDGSVKLLDFGIAKLLETDPVTGIAGVTGDETVTQMRAMTLEYASPEQVSGGTVTTVSDVYSLGVVLYRLLTGKSPYASRTNDAARIAEILSDTTPTRPSLVRPLDADLDNILLMALRKEPQRRYGSVEQLANDLRNFLAGLPVNARGNAFSYRFGKFIRRRKIEIAAAALVIASLVVGLGLAIHEARVAEQQRVIAQRHFASVRKLANKLFDVHDEIAEMPGATKAREMLVKTSLEYLDALYQEAGTDAALQEELGVAYRKVGDIQGWQYGGNTGDSKAALESYTRSVALLEPLYAATPKNPRVGVLLAKSYLQLGSSTYFTAGAQAAQPVMRKAVAVAESSVAGPADELERMNLLGNVYWLEAMVSGTLGDFPAGLSAINKMVAVAEDYAARHPEDTRGLEALEAVYSNAGIGADPRMTPQQSFDRLFAFLRKAAAASEKLIALEPQVAKHRWKLAETRFNLATLFIDHDRHAEALEQLRLASPVLAERASDRNNAHAQLVSLMAESSLAWTLFKTGHVEAAEQSMRASGKALAAMAEKDENLQLVFILAKNRIHLAELYVTRGDRDDWRMARAVLPPGIAGLRKVKEAAPEMEEADQLLLNGAALLEKVNGAGPGNRDKYR